MTMHTWWGMSPGRIRPLWGGPGCLGRGPPRGVGVPPHGERRIQLESRIRLHSCNQLERRIQPESLATCNPHGAGCSVAKVDGIG